MIVPEPIKDHSFPFILDYSTYQEYTKYGSRDKTYYDLLLNKKVIVIGPSPNLLNQNLGNYIDSFDLVVRLNQSYPLENQYSNDLGTKTDILYHCLNEDPRCGNTIHYDLMVEENIFLSSPYPKNVSPFHNDVIKFETQNKNRISYHIIDTEFYLILASSLKTRLNTGTACILDLLSYPVKELYVYGFTWYKDGWRDSYKTNGVIENEIRNNPIHSQTPQMNIIKELALQDKRLYIDDTMKQILEI